MNTPDSDNPYQPSSQMDMHNPTPVDDGQLTAVDWVLCVLCSLIGCIVGIVRTVQGKKSGPKMIGISIAFAILWNLIRFGLEILVQQ